MSDRQESNLISTDLSKLGAPLPDHPLSLFADMNGDGIADYVTIAHTPLKNDYHIVYYPGDGRGNFLCDPAKDLCENPAPPECPSGSAPSCSLPRVAISVAPGTTGIFPEIILGLPDLYIRDVNGDGLADVVQYTYAAFPSGIGGIGAHIWLNEDGRRFRKPHTETCNQLGGCADVRIIDPEQPRLDLSDARLAMADMNGDGVDDIVFITPKSVFYIDMFFSHLVAVHAGLLSKIENGLGVSTEIKYRNIAELDQEAFRWKVGWASDLPASSPVVTEVTTRNQLPSPFGTERRIVYEYRDPAYDPWEGRLLGFRFTVITEVGRNLATTQVFAYGPCQPLRAAANCSGTSDNDELNAVTGVPVLIDTYAPKNAGDLVPGNFPSLAFVNFSTTHYTYESKILMTGSDGRAVNFAYPQQTDTYLYDAGNFQPSPQTVKYTDYEHIGPESVQRSERDVTTWSQAGREHLRTAQKIDNFGNIREASDFGRVDDAGRPLDDPIFTETKFDFRGTTGWQWRPTTVTVSSGSGAGRPRTLDYSYDPDTGDLGEVTSELAGTLPLDRFHEDPSRKVADLPQGASRDGKIRLLHLTYGSDKLGNVELREGPQVTTTAGPSTRCQRFTYDGPYQQLPLTITSYNGACAVAAGQTASFDFDRGFGALTTVTTPSGAIAVTELDGFGRPTAVRRPATGSVGAELAPSVRIEYKLTAGGPVQKVHTFKPDGETWIYLDGFGQELLTLRQADPARGDKGDWVGTGLLPRVDGLVSELHESWFYSGDPENHPIAAPQGRGSPLASLQYDQLARLFQRFDSTGRTTIVHHALSEDHFDAEQNKPNGPHTNAPITVTHDGHGRNTTVIRRVAQNSAVDEIKTQFSYLPTGEVDRLEQTHSAGPESVVRWMEYDSLGRMVLNAEANSSAHFTPDPTSAQAVNAMKAWRYAYDDAGAMVGTSDARGCGANFFYDGLGRFVAEDDSPCLSSQMLYSPPDLNTGDGTKSFVQYDAPEPGQTADLGANPLFLVGKAASMRDRGTQTRFTYDGRGRIVAVARRIAKPGDTSVLLRDRYAASWFHSTTAYDNADRPIERSTGADVPELLVSFIVPDSVIKTQYSRRGLVANLASSYGPLMTSASYDANGLPLIRTYGDVAQTTAAFQYDPASLRLTRYTLSRRAPPLWASPTGAYFPPGPNDPPTRQEVVEDQQFGYDDAGNITAVDDLRAAGEWAPGSKPAGRHMKYDDLYRLLELDYSYAAPGSDSFVAPFTAEALMLSGIPIPWSQPQQRVKQQMFHYDWLGNTTRSTDDANVGYDRSSGDMTYGTAAFGPNQLVSATAGIQAKYDAAGNLRDLTLQRPSTCSSPEGLCTHRFAYDWDEVGRLSRARRWDFATVSAAELALPLLPPTPPAIDLRYTYGLGGRVLKTAAAPDGTETHTVEIFDSLRLDRTSFDAVTSDYNRSAATESVIIGDIARVVHAPQLPRGPAGNPQHVLLQFSDWLGLSTSVVDKDTSEVVERLTYQAYGGTELDYRPPRWANNREDFRFSGKEDDFAVGLIFFGARYYQAALGRWASADPLAIHGLAGGLNPYQYVSSSPHNGVDPVGLCDSSSQSCEPPQFCWPICFGGEGGGGGGPPGGDAGPNPSRPPGSLAAGPLPNPHGGTPVPLPPPPLPPYAVGPPATGVFETTSPPPPPDPGVAVSAGGAGGYLIPDTTIRDLDTAAEWVAASTLAVEFVLSGVALEAAYGPAVYTQLSRLAPGIARLFTGSTTAAVVRATEEGASPPNVFRVANPVLSDVYSSAVAEAIGTLEATGNPALTGGVFHQAIGAARIGSDFPAAYGGAATIEVKTIWTGDLAEVAAAASQQSLRDTALVNAANGGLSRIRMVKIFDFSTGSIYIAH